MAAFSPAMPMAPPPTDVPLQRPSMRRKSSAQNLLSSFKSPTQSSQAYQSGTVSSATSIQYVSAVTAAQNTGLPKDWEVQSLQSESAASSSTLPVAANGAAVQGTTVEILREVVRKRIITLTYLRNVHEGRSHWFHTIMITRAELDRVFNNSAMKSRTYRFAILGMSLAQSFDVKEPQDLLRGLSNALIEYDQNKDDHERDRDRDRDRNRMRSLFRPGRQRRPAGASDFSVSYADASDTSFLVLPHAPFPLDYHQTLLSLLDVLSEVYNKISKILGPSAFPISGQHMMGPLGLLSPHPGVSYLFSGTDAASSHDGDSSLWGIAHANGIAGYSGSLGSPPPSWNTAMSDTIRQIDSRLKKLIAMLLKELDDCARQGIRDELASLDPLLRNVAVPDEGRDTHDFE